MVASFPFKMSRWKLLGPPSCIGLQSCPRSCQHVQLRLDLPSKKSVIPTPPPPAGSKERPTDPLIFISIPLLIGSWAPYTLIRLSIFNACCVSSQFFNLTSRGCLPFTSAQTECKPSRIGSGIERTLGAPLEVEICVAWLEAGAMRRDYEVLSVHMTST